MKDKLFKHLVIAFFGVILSFGFTACNGGSGNGCNGCGGHTHVYNEVVKEEYLKDEAACNRGALYYKSCSCGAKSEETFEFGAKGDHRVKLDAFYSDGVYYETETCKDCLRLYWVGGSAAGDEGCLKDGVLHPHDWYLKEYSFDEPTCTESVLTAWYECTNCGKDIRKYKNALGHSYTNFKVVEEATCTTAGRSEGNCKRCGKLEVRTISPRHKWNSGEVIVSAGCLTEGEGLYTCTVCSETKTYTISAKGHKWGNWMETKTPNCTEEGEQIRRCRRCGETETEILPIRHQWDNGTIIKEETCTTNGERKYVCRLCGKIEIETIWARHIWEKEGEIILEPTCTEYGIERIACTRCDSMYERRLVPSHDYQIISRVEPTCTEWGYEIKQCSRCGDIIEGELPGGHNMDYGYDENQHWYECQRSCGYMEGGREDHTLEYEYRTKEINDGTQITYEHSLYMICTVCGYEKHMGTSSTHMHYAIKIVDGVAPTCTGVGYTPSLVCGVAGCGDVLVAPEEIPALGHNYVNDICSRCGGVVGSEGLEYILSNDGTYYSVKMGTCKATKIIIPSTYEGLPVKEIADSAFYNCRGSFTEIIISDGVTRIGSCAFFGCDNLVKITIPKSVISIDVGAFWLCGGIPANPSISIIKNGGCLCGYRADVYYQGELEDWYKIQFVREYFIDFISHLDVGSLLHANNLYINNQLMSEITELVIPNTITEIGVSTFCNWNWLTKVTIPDSVTSIGSGAFFGCNSLTEIEIPDNVTSIGKYAFYDCSSLTEIVISDSVTSIGNGAFWHCSSLTEIVIPDSVTSIGDDAFRNTGYYNDESNWENGVLYIGKYLIDAKTNITGVYTIKDGTLCIADSAFAHCSSLTEIVIPDSVTSIGEWAFYRCSSLTSVTIGNSVTSIGEDAFFWCDSLTEIVIPDSVTSIGEYAFYKCSSLTSITFEGTVAQWNAIEKGEDWNYEVPATEVVCLDGVVTL